jgi:predicted ATP-dependent endonuclease of OLD family
MKIKEIQVKNYRLLKDFSIDIEKELSLVIGKNNCGKTSFLSVIDKFLNGNSSSFTYEDFLKELDKDRTEKNVNMQFLYLY